MVTPYIPDVLRAISSALATTSARVCKSSHLTMALAGAVAVAVDVAVADAAAGAAAAGARLLLRPRLILSLTETFSLNVGDNASRNLATNSRLVIIKGGFSSFLASVRNFLLNLRYSSYSSRPRFLNERVICINLLMVPDSAS